MNNEVNNNQVNNEAETKSAHKKKKNIFRNQIGTIITVAVVAAVLLVVYFTLIQPMIKDDAEPAPTDSGIELIWQDEVRFTTSRILVYEQIRRDDIKSIKIHNPTNKDKYGDQYVDWGIYLFEGKDPEELLQDGGLYLTDYEYAPVNETMLSYLINACGTATATARVEDHCTDFAKYGLNYEGDEDALYYEITKKDGTSYKVYIGDMLPSGNGYYIRVVGNDVKLSDGSETLRDSVYVSGNGYITTTVMASPQAMITPYLTCPLIMSSTEASLEIFMLANNQTNKAFAFRPIDDKKDPFSVFSGMSVYNTFVPGGNNADDSYVFESAGYYSSSAFEDMIPSMEDFQGGQVVELATLQKADDGTEYYGFTEETFKKYHLSDEYMYSLTIQNEGVQSTIVVSPLQENSYYYVYSMFFNTIIKVNYEKLFFISWEFENFISNEVFIMNINDMESFSIKGSYFDMGLDHPDRYGSHTIDETFRLNGDAKELTVNAIKAGKTVDTATFRQYFRLFIQMYCRERAAEADIEEALKNEPIATFTVVTREQKVYKVDAEGKETGELDYTRPSVTREFNFYKLTNGRSLVTSVSIDENGKATEEVGDFYLMSARVEQLLSATLTLLEGGEINGTDRY